jgi:nucleotide-binding universal stress UspA family protein
VHESGKDGPGVILVGLDASDTSARAAAYAAGLARRQHSKLAIVYVIGPPALAGFSPGAMAGIASTNEEIAADLRAQVEAGAADLGIDYEFYLRYGDPYQQLVAVADDTRADAIVVGASASVGHRITGSLAVKLVRAGRWPVTVVP